LLGRPLPHRRSDRSGAGPNSSPQCFFTPLEGFPSSAAVPCHHGRCLLDVPLTPALPSSPPKSRSLQPATVPLASEETLVSAFVVTEAPLCADQTVPCPHLGRSRHPGLVFAISEEMTRPIHQDCDSVAHRTPAQRAVIRCEPDITPKSSAEHGPVLPSEEGRPSPRCSGSREILPSAQATLPASRGRPSKCLPNQSSVKPDSDANDAPSCRNMCAHPRVSPKPSSGRSPLLLKSFATPPTLHTASGVHCRLTP
jgi:hypothetical protein